MPAKGTSVPVDRGWLGAGAPLGRSSLKGFWAAFEPVRDEWRSRRDLMLHLMLYQVVSRRWLRCGTGTRADEAATVSPSC